MSWFTLKWNSPPSALHLPAVEFVAASRRLASKGFTAEMAWARLSRVLKAFQFVVPTRDTLQSARRLHLEQQWAFWDALVIASCIDAGVTRFYSEDLPGHKPPTGLEIINPFAG